MPSTLLEWIGFGIWLGSLLLAVWVGLMIGFTLVMFKLWDHLPAGTHVRTRLWEVDVYDDGRYLRLGFVERRRPR
jgi:hypothetical protein